jgi:hypothetical protein
MGKTITLTEEAIKEIVSKCIDAYHYNCENGNSCSLEEVISYNLYKYGIINEMALKRKDFVNHIVSFRCQLIENWCLCAYCSLYDGENNNFHHWECEFIAHADNIKNCKLKNGDKGKVLHKTYISDFDLNDPKMIEQIIKCKFQKEGIEEEYIGIIAQMCASSAISLVKFLGSDTYPSEEYVVRTFGNNVSFEEKNRILV